ncbi:hypothetical protein LOY34_13040 [Pseudomonas sp. B21-009]|uniref:hypothetical protein n=1 Tax=Pseudomonas sp. B21-009 TaxID=2895470 RepID=UPI002160B054|nr:hypothetical protein [Pseudomonas sp. B21-009]UVM69406.1 hypothetical protein LOY34_13040 [Pseudomonas sp. B21-009]
MAVRLEFLTQDPEEVALVTRYWAMDEEGVFLEKVNTLVPFREVTQSGAIAKYVRALCQAIDENQMCRNCGGPITVGSRAEVKKTFQESGPCEPCALEIRQKKQEAQHLEEIELQKQLAKHAERARATKISYNGLKDDQRFILMAMDTLLGPRLAFEAFREREIADLSPWNAGSYLTRLYNSGVILDDPSQARKGTYYLHDGKLHAQWQSIQYFLPPDQFWGRGIEGLDHLKEKPFTDAESLTNLWFDYAVGDVIRYLVDNCHTFNLDLNREEIEKIESSVRHGLENYSVAQLWFVMWKVVKDTSSLANRQYWNRNKAAATIPNQVRKQIEKADKEGGIDKYWNRPEHHISGALGMEFISVFDINELTTGRQVRAKFVQCNPAPVLDIENLATSVLETALSSNISHWTISKFAELVRQGLDTNDALTELVKRNPEVFSEL